MKCNSIAYVYRSFGATLKSLADHVFLQKRTSRKWFCTKNCIVRSKVLLSGQVFWETFSVLEILLHQKWFKAALAGPTCLVAASTCPTSVAQLNLPKSSSITRVASKIILPREPQWPNGERQDAVVVLVAVVVVVVIVDRIGSDGTCWHVFANTRHIRHSTKKRTYGGLTVPLWRIVDQLRRAEKRAFSRHPAMEQHWVFVHIYMNFKKQKTVACISNQKSSLLRSSWA